MEKQAASRKVYQHHRNRQRIAILEAARKLFIQKGIPGTTLGEIADEARVTRSTLHHYFGNLPKIAWAILEEDFEHAKEDIDSALQKSGTGYERIEAFLSGFLSRMTRNPEHFRFLAQFDAMYANEPEINRLLELVQRTFGGTSVPLANVVRLGIEDGSLQPDLNPTLMAAVLANMATAMVARLEAHRASVTVEYGYAPEAIFTETCRLFLQSIRAR